MLDLSFRFANHREAFKWYTGAERRLLVSYRGEQAFWLQRILREVAESHKEFWLHQLHEEARFTKGAGKTSYSDGDDEKQNAVHAQTEIWKMAQELKEQDKLKEQWAKITRVGQTVAGTITRFGDNEQGPFMILGNVEGKGPFAYAREQVGGEWMKHNAFAVGLSAGLVRKINTDKHKGAAVLCHFHDTEVMEKGGTKKLFKVMVLDAAELAEIESKATDTREQRAAREQQTGKPEPIFAEQTKTATGDSADNLI